MEGQRLLVGDFLTKAPAIATPEMTERVTTKHFPSTSAVAATPNSTPPLRSPPCIFRPYIARAFSINTTQ